MESGRVAAAAVVAFIGLSFLVGFFRAFRDRIYLALLALSFFAVAGRILAPRPPQYNWLKYSLLALAAVFFVGAAYFAVRQTLVQIRLIRERRVGLEREMYAYLEQLQKQTAQRTAADSQPPASSGDGPAPPRDKQGAETGGGGA
jgi:hypothetical protein